MPDEMMEKWLEYYDENGLTWLDTGVQAAIKQAFFAGIKAVEQPLAPDVLTAWGNLGKCSICGLAYDVCECIARR